MYIYRTDCVDPKYNLATEEYLTKSNKFEEPILFLWQNDNTIVVGRNQNAASEINLQSAESDNVNIIRRNTGGGTVFHDLGNMNFSIIYTDKENKGVSMFSQMLEPVIETLNRLGVKAEFSGRNDIVLNGKKISGNAMWKYKDRFLQHGTILFNANLDKLTKYLTVDRAKILSKNIASIAARVTNINSEVDEKIDIMVFWDELINTYKKNDSVKNLELTSNDIEEIKSIYENKYKDPNWTFTKNANFDYVNKTRLEGKGSFEIYMNVIDNKIKNIKIFGDFLGYFGTETLEDKLVNVEYKASEIKKVIESLNIKDIFGENIEVQDILNLLIE
ncbi:lipoate--protein ligase [Spiroplasma turonicum]|uniref:lipoate--protein ligase n=1 Tax=Spiroplasma turonicum TaxID=216946 RepID=A0A0K1P5W1_9MOLU|nr:lipoate--protein ligase [Spiroplasma turonicum]AKU79703.1 lipoate protein ligase A [Spiroplasma turonicum]ALX70721.1 lipoate protein ligase A [Spiroplasma turonicum]